MIFVDTLAGPFVANGFMLNALLAGVLVSVACGIVGTFVVLRGLAFIGDALAHGVLPGVAIAMLLGLPGMVGAAAGSLVMILGISAITRRSNLSADTAIGLLFVGMLALGVAIVSHSGTFTGDLVHILFGEILGIATVEILVQLAATVFVAAVAAVCYRPFLLLCFDPEQADVSGFSSKRFHGIMLALIALTVVFSFRTVGTLLVFGMLLAPAATAALFSRKIASMIALASIIGAFSTYTGLLVSYHANVAAGASITLVTTVVFFAALIARRLVRSSAGAPSRELPFNRGAESASRQIRNGITSRVSVSSAGESAIEARALSLGYGDRAVIAGVEFTLEKGKTLALVGSNGSGKTTVLKAIASLLPPLSGELRVFGTAPGAFPARVAYLGQFHPASFVLPLRSIDVVRMARFAEQGLLGRASREDERWVEEAMEIMEVAGLRNEPLNRLSGGQRQRVHIAQALARGAELLLLDEPAANLDSSGRETYRRVVRAATDAGCTAVVATHDIDEAAGCDYAMLLAQRVVAFGKGREVLTAEALLSTFGVVARYGEGGVMVIDHHHDCGHSDEAP